MSIKLTLEFSHADKAAISKAAELLQALAGGEVRPANEESAISSAEQHIHETAAGPETTAPTETTENTATAGGGKPTHDEKGVQFIPAICANAAEPFYKSGPQKGQWKRKKGVSEEQYNTVYNNALNQINGTAGNTETSQQTVNPAQQAAAQTTAAQVFGGQQQAAQTQTAATPQQVFEKFTALAAAGHAEACNNVCAQNGIANVSLIYSRPDLAPAIMAGFEALGG